MAKSSAARLQRSRDRETILESVRNPARAAAPADLDRLIHEHVRLGIVSALAVNRALTFNELKALRQLERPRAKARRGGLHRLRKVFRRTHAENRVSADRVGTQGARAISQSYGSADPRDARRVGTRRKIFAPGLCEAK